MKSLNLLILLGTAMLALTGCSTVKVQTDYDRSVAFGQYRTYTLSPAAQGLTLSPTSEAALRDSLRNAFATCSITEATGQGADLEVVRHVFTRDQTSVQQYTDWGYS